MEQARSRFQISCSEKVPASSDQIEKMLSDLAEEGNHELIIGFGYASGAPIAQLAHKLPHQKFAVVDSRIEAKNVVSYIARQFDIGFLAGFAGALVSSTKSVGAILGVDDENMRRWVAGYTAGAKHYGSDVSVYYSLVGSWDDPATAYRQALQQRGKGVDVIMAHTNAGDAGILKAAAESELMIIGWSGERKVAPDKVLFDVERHAEICVLDAVASVVQGGFSGGIRVFGLAEGNWRLTLDDRHQSVTEEHVNQIKRVERSITAGQTKIPQAVEDAIHMAVRI